MIVQMSLLVIPSSLLMVASVFAYGPVKGVLIILAAVWAASSIAYGIGVYLGLSTVNQLLGGNAKDKFQDFLRRYDFWAIIIARLFPFLSNDAVSWVAGILRMGY